MHHVAIPDPLFAQAERLAGASGISVERLVHEALELRLADDSEDQGFDLTPQQMAAVRKAEASIDAGQGRTMDQLEKNLSAKKAAWPRENLR